MTDFITYGEAIRLMGLRKTWRLMRQALGIRKPLAPSNELPDQAGASPALKEPATGGGTDRPV